MKKLLIYILLLTCIFVSCSSTKNVKPTKTIRRIDELERNKYKVARKNKKAIDDFIDAANNGNREVRSLAIWVLASNKIELAYNDFIRLSKEDSDFNVRAMAVFGISKVGIKDNLGISAITRAMNDTDTQVQIEAVKAAGVLKNQEFLNPLLQNLGNKNKWIKLASIEALKDYNDERVSSSLNSLLKTENDISVRSLISQVIAYREGSGL